jgi:hypothetical protein
LDPVRRDPREVGAVALADKGRAQRDGGHGAIDQNRTILGHVLPSALSVADIGR